MLLQHTIALPLTKLRQLLNPCNSQEICPVNMQSSTPAASVDDDVLLETLADPSTAQERQPDKSGNTYVYETSEEAESGTGHAARSSTLHQRSEKQPGWAKRLIFWRKGAASPVPAQRGESLEYTAGVLSQLYFQWMVPLLSVGYRRPLELNDIWQVNPKRSLDRLAPGFEGALACRLRSKSRLDPLLLALYDTLKFNFVVGGLAQLIAGSIQVLTPFVLKYLIAFVQEAFIAYATGGISPHVGRGIGLVIGIACMQVLQSLCANQYYYNGMLLGGQARSTMIACIFKKGLKLSGRAKVGNETTAWNNGRINSLMSTDTSRIESACITIHRCWVAPIQVALALALLCVNLGYSALVGFSLVCLAMPLLGRAVKSLMRRRKAINVITDQRLQLTQETFGSMRTVKFFVWESKLLARLTAIRNLETSKLSFVLMLRNAILATAIIVPIIASILTFVTYSLSNHTLDPAPIFSSLALFAVLGVPLEILPVAIGRAIDAYASMKRISKFFTAEEMDGASTAGQDDFADGQAVAEHKGRLTLANACFTWEQGTTEAESDGKEPIDPKVDEAGKAFSISEINLSVGPTEFIAVIGTVSSGKSSLISALAGEMRMTSGQMLQNGSRSLCAQSPWIQSASLRQNIVFGKPVEDDWYTSVVKACALEPDISTLPEGDRTEIGEKGVTISGGQKQRINIARAIYFDADIVLMDDPLSAVDAHVGQHIVDHAICGLLKNKCRILATHQLHFLERADRIVWMKSGSIHKVGTYTELLGSDAEFQGMLQAATKSSGRKDTTDQSKIDSPAAESEKPSKKTDTTPATTGTALMQQEERATGSVNLSIYGAFVRASGSLWNIVVVIGVLSIAQGTNILTSLWLSFWISDRFPNLQLSQYIAVYVALGVVQAILLFSYATTLTTLSARASRNMLNYAVAHVLKAPISFFDTTPLGRIINRFSKDVDTMDNRLADDLRFFLFIIATVLSVFGLVIAYYYYFVIALVPVFAAFILTAGYYRTTAREIKRHEALLRSNVFARFGEGIAGTTTIRAFGIQAQFVKSLSHSLDSMDGAYFLTFAGQRWLSTRLDVVGILLVLVAGILIVTSRISINASIAGLILSYMLSTVQLMQETVHVFADVENEMNSTERLYHYANDLEQESTPPGPQLRPTWPETAAVKFSDVHMRYRQNLPLVLNGLCFDVQPGHHVGIIGRTGAGKSSIISAIFRLMNIQGTISIDGVDIAKVPLQNLRSRLAIIPQDPVLFRGSVRSNLDPFGDYDDLSLWAALTQAGFADQKIASNAEKSLSISLDAAVEDEGANLSLGQRQLLALARVLLRDSRLVMFDEATSSVDYETDQRIQQVISRQFKDRTLLCIAHRLKTVIG